MRQALVGVLEWGMRQAGRWLWPQHGRGGPREGGSCMFGSHPGLHRQVTRLYEEQLVDPSLWEFGAFVMKRMRDTIDSVLLVTEEKELLVNQPVLKRAIDNRMPSVDPINILQAVLMKRAVADEENPELLDALKVTVQGIAAGMQFTG